MEVASASTARHEKAPGSATADVMVVDEDSACVVVSGSPAAKTASATPNSSAKKPAAARPKKAKDGTPASRKKAVQSKAESGLRGISSFLVCAISMRVLEPVQSSRSSRSLRTPSAVTEPEALRQRVAASAMSRGDGHEKLPSVLMGGSGAWYGQVKKPKPDADSPPAKTSAKGKDAEGDIAMSATMDELATAGLPVAPVAERRGAAPVQSADAQAEREVVNLVSPQGSPSKGKPCKETGDRGAEAPTQSKRQCVRYNETQMRKLEALFALGEGKFNFAAVCTQATFAQSLLFVLPVLS